MGEITKNEKMLLQGTQEARSKKQKLTETGLEPAISSVMVLTCQPKTGALPLGHPAGVKGFMVLFAYISWVVIEMSDN